MSSRHLETGRAGELLAADYLAGKGLRLLTRNYRARTGEIDIIARDGDTYVFIEVKTRKDLRYGEPAEAVTAAKIRHLSAAALSYLQRHGIDDAAVRFDVVSILLHPLGPKITHIPAAFEAP